MKTPSNDIFILIKSLDPRETAYLKGIMKESLRHKNYVLMFDSIYKMKHYDENELKRIVKELGVSDEFKHLKSRFFNFVLKTLCNYYSDSSLKKVIRNFIYSAEILMQRKLFDAAEKELNKAEKLAKKAQDPSLLLEISNTRIGYYLGEKLLDKIDNYYNTKQFDVSLENIKAIKESIHLNKKRTRLLQLHIRERASKSDFKEIKKIYASFFNLDVVNCNTFSSKNYYYSSCFIYDHSIHNITKDSRLRQMEWIAYLEKEKELLKYRLSTYIVAYINLITIDAHLKNKQGIDKALDKIAKLYALSPLKLKTKKTTELLNNLSLHYIGCLAYANQFDKAASYWENIEIEFTKKTLRDTTFIALHNNLFIIYFSLNNFRKSLKHANIVLNFKSNHVLILQVYSIVFVLINHYELKNYELLAYIAKQNEFFLKQHNSKSALITEILHFFSDTSIINWTTDAKRDAFKKLLKKLQFIIENPIENKLLNYFDIISWIESHIQNRPFVDIVKEKLN